MPAMHGSPLAGTPALATPPLSTRERQIAEMMTRGLTNAEIADQLGVTSHAIKFHLSSIYRKLGVANRTEAAVAYLNLHHRSAA